MTHFSFDHDNKLDSAVYGFDSYSTKDTADTKTRQRIVVSPADVILEIKELRKVISEPRILGALAKLEQHINDKNNPHQTDLSQFSEEISDVLYKGYKEAGGTGSYAKFIEYLFSNVRVALGDEIYTSSNTLLVCTASARKYLKEHEADVNAHSALIENQFPGSPVLVDPILAMYNTIGIPPAWVDYTDNLEEDVPYTYVDKKGVLKTELSGKLPLDYFNGIPYIPCFGNNTNEITNSEDFTTLIHQNTNSMKSSDVKDPTQNTNATVILGNEDHAEIEHSIIIKEVQYNYLKTFSVFVKAGTCDVFSICITDNASTTAETRAQFNLTNGNTLMFNHYDRYTCRMRALVNGWYRCELTLNSSIINITRLRMLFHKVSDPLASSSLSFKSTNEEVLGYLFGMQLEVGHRASPYIPTHGETRTRRALGITCTLDDTYDSFSQATFFLNSKKLCKEAKPNPVFTLKDNQNKKNVLAVINYTGDITVEHVTEHIVNNETVTTIEHISYVKATDEKVAKLVNTTNATTISSYLNENKISSDAPKNNFSICKVELGHDGNNYLNDYLVSALTYNSALSESQVKFILGDEL